MERRCEKKADKNEREGKAPIVSTCAGEPPGHVADTSEKVRPLHHLARAHSSFTSAIARSEVSSVMWWTGTMMHEWSGVTTRREKAERNERESRSQKRKHPQHLRVRASWSCACGDRPKKYTARRERQHIYMYLRQDPLDLSFWSFLTFCTMV